MIDTKGLDPVDVLCALYDNAKVQGLGIFHFIPGRMTREEAVELLKGNKYFDYIHGRVMKVNLKNPEGFDGWLYDRNNGNGAAGRVISQLRNRKNN